MRENHATHSRNRIEQAVLDQRVLHAAHVALPPAAVAVAHGRPRPVHPRAAAAKEQVVVPLVLRRGGPAAPEETRGRALDGEHDRRVVRRREDVAAEAVCVGLPAERIALQRNIV